jgi:hypothetical protein
MGYLAVWKIQEEMIVDFRKRGAYIPDRIMNDLKSARTLIRILKADSCQEDTVQKIETYMTIVESFLVSEGEKLFGTGYVDEWLRRLGEADRKITEEDVEETRFIPGLPRGHQWIRVKSSAELPLEKLKTLAEESKLSYKTQKDGYLLVYGKDEHVKDFVKKMTTKYTSTTEKRR